MDSTKIHYIQHGVDGFGHQLYGLFTCLLLHNVGPYRFDADAFLKKRFKFQHIGFLQARTARKYLREIVQQFKIDQRPDAHRYLEQQYLAAIQLIPEDWDSSTLYSVDNAYVAEALRLSPAERIQHEANVDRIRDYFINRVLPSSRLQKENIVIHVRLGDAMATSRGESIRRLNKLLPETVKLLRRRFPDSHCYIHSDGDVAWLVKDLPQNRVSVFEKNTPMMQVISDFVHAKRFVCGDSALSKVASFLGNKELILTDSDRGYVMPTKNVQTIEEFVSGRDETALKIRASA